MNGFKVIRIVCTKTGALKNIIYESDNCYALAIKNGEVVSNLPLRVSNFEDTTKQQIFDITNPIDFDEKKGVRTMDGIFSPKFGVDIFTNIFNECYRIVQGFMANRKVHLNDVL